MYETYQDKRIALDKLSALKVTITPAIKRQALESYRELPMLILYPDSYALFVSDEEWFIQTQLKAIFCDKSIAIDRLRPSGN